MLRKPGLLILFSIFLVLFGCKISGRVTQDGVGVSGVTITLSGDANMTAVTDSEGYYIFESVDAGTYTVTMDPPPGYTRSISRNVVKDGDYSDISGIDFDFETATLRDTETGQVIGFQDDNGVHAWLGIPFAQAPVDHLRWKAPLPAESWASEGAYLSLEIGPVCPQIADLLVDVPGAQSGDPVGSEDCLFLNIWAPEFTPATIPSEGSRLPVMVWIHGGGNSVGHGGSYNGKRLASLYDLIIVTFNYRLGPFGWFTHPALTTGMGLDDSGNYGTLDVIRVLGWVQNNIANFGGNPNNVTLFGESAGARNTLSMMLSPEATGLFHKAIAESGGIETIEVTRGQNYIENGGHSFSSREVVNALLIADDDYPLIADRAAAMAHQDSMSDLEIAAYLYGKSSAEILSVYNGGYGGMISFPSLFRDGLVLPPGEPLALFEDTANYNAVPLITGTNRDESKLFMILNPDFVDIVDGLPLGAKDEYYYQLYSSYISDAVKANDVDALAAVLSDTPGQPGVYAYRFDWDEEPTVLGVDIGLLLGAGHGVEISFVFYNFQQFLVPQYAPLVFTEDNAPGREALGTSMSSYWAEFAYTGLPGAGRGGLEVPWAAWNNTAGSDKFIIFDTAADSGIRMSSEMVTLSSLHDRLINETGFPRQKQHCDMYLELFEGTALWDEDTYNNLGSEGCLSDLDSDGYYGAEDCDDDDSDDGACPTGTCIDECICGNGNCACCARCVNPDAYEVAGDGIDSNCSGQDDCFIATAAFESKLNDKVDVLRTFRDKYLMNSYIGEILVEAYYEFSPPIAAYIADRPWLKALVRSILVPVAGILSLFI